MPRKPFRTGALLLALLGAALPWSATAPAQAAEPPSRLLVLDLEASQQAAEMAQPLGEVLLIELERDAHFQVVSPRELQAALKAGELRAMLEGGDEAGEGQAAARLAGLGRAVQAPYVLRSSLGAVGSTWVLSLSRIDVERSEVVQRVSQTLVGDSDGLVGAIRSACLALALRREGVADTLTTELLEQLKIAQQEKRVLLTLAPGYELALGPTQDEDHILYARPDLARLRLELQLHLSGPLRGLLSLGYGHSLAARLRMQDKHLATVEQQDGTSGHKVFTASTALDFAAERWDAALALELIPETGRFLPFLLVGGGMAWQRYAFGDEELVVVQHSTLDAGCTPPYAPVDGRCTLRVTGRSRGEISAPGLLGILGVGAEWLATAHLGLRLEARYHAIWTWKDPAELDAIFLSDRLDYEAQTEQGPVQRSERYGDVFPVRAIHHGLELSVAALGYW